MSLNRLLEQKALEIGFDIAGIAPVEIWKDLDFARRWVEQGYSGEMRYLQNPKRHDPRQVLASARSVICVGLVYNAPYPYSTEVASVPRSTEKQPQPELPSEVPVSRSWVSRYAWGRDYHDVMRKKLERLRKAIEDLAPGTETRVYVDTGPVVERAFARYSGIGWTGKNTCLINPSKGSWFFLGVILTSLALEPDLPVPDRCGSCTRCLDACPTGALTEPYVMDASRCIAYFNIELKGSIPEQFRSQIGSNLFGCDICQDVCPWNRKQKSEVRSRNNTVSHQPSVSISQPAEKGFGRPGAAVTTLPEFQPLEVILAPARVRPEHAAEDSGSHGEVSRAKEGVSGTPHAKENPSSPRSLSLFNPPLDALAQITKEDFRCAFAHSPIKRPKYRGWLRNLCVVMGNCGDSRVIPKLEELSRHEDPIVREHADWALAQFAED